MEYFMYVCPACKKIYKVKESGKTVKCNNCSDTLLDMNVTIEKWEAFNSQEKEKHKASVLNTGIIKENKEAIIKHESSTNSEITHLTQYMYCCHECKSLEIHEKPEEKYPCKKCGKELVPLKIEDAVWKRLDNDDKKKRIINAKDNKKKSIVSSEETNDIKVSNPQKEIPLNETKDINNVQEKNKGFSFFGDDVVNTPSIKKTDNVKCPECGVAIDKECKECPNCGYPINVELNDVYNANNQICPECRQRISSKCITCPNCGFPIQKGIVGDEAREKSEIKKSSPQKDFHITKGAIVGIIVTLVAVLTVCGYAFREYFASEVTIGGYSGIVLGVGDTKTLHAYVKPKFADTGNIKWTSSDESVATVNDGKVTITGTGNSTITAKTKNGKTGTIEVTAANIIGEWSYEGYSKSSDFYGDFIHEPLLSSMIYISGHDVEFTLLMDFNNPTKGKWELGEPLNGIEFYWVTTDDGGKYFIRTDGERMVVTFDDANFSFTRDI